MRTRVLSATREVVIGDGLPTVLIGERINPSGKKLLTESLRAGDMEIVRREAREQFDAGADIINLNVSVFDTDEVKLLTEAVKTVTEVMDIPLCLDSTSPEALETALKICPGRPLINSVTGEERSLSRLLPLIKEYNVPVVGLLQDESGLPKEVEKRLAIARKILERAERTGIPCEDVIIDCLTFAIGADSASAQITLETIRRVRDELGVNMTLGVSNVSFGMPERNVINSAFISMAIYAGCTSLIVDVARVRQTVLAADFILERDRYARRYLADFRSRQKAVKET